MVSLGSHLQRLRVVQGMSPTRLAREARISRTSIYNWERDRSQPRLPELEAVLRILRATPREARQALELLPAPRAQRLLTSAAAVDFPIALPHAGDLLRALRHRRGWTQAQVAAAMRVRQPTVARWERGESWPEPERLRPLCSALGARETEFTTLSQGPYAFASPFCAPSENADIESTALRLAALERTLKSGEGYLLGDLLYLSLEAQAASLIAQGEEGRVCVAKVLLSHAAYLSERCQPTEAGRIAEQAQALLPLRGDRWNDLRVSAEMYWAVWKFPIARHDRILGHWLSRPLPLNSRTWIMNQIGGSLCDQGKWDDALALARNAFHLTEQEGDLVQIQRRRRNYGEFLLEAGRYAEALELMTIPEDYSLPMQVRAQLDLVRANLASGNRAHAHEWMQKAQTTNTLIGTAYYEPQINELSAKL